MCDKSHFEALEYRVIASTNNIPACLTTEEIAHNYAIDKARFTLTG